MDDLRINDEVSIPLAEIEIRATRSSGPGGQHANVTESRIEAKFDVAASASLTEVQRIRIAERAGGVVTAVSQDSRSQARNRELALERLAAKLAAGLRKPKRRRPTKPSRTAKRKRVEQKRRRGEIKRTRRRPADD